MKTRIVALLSLGLVASLAADVKADFVTNGSFEAPTATPPFQTFGLGSTAITGWTVINGTNSTNGSVDLTNGFIVAHSGNQAVDLDGTSSTPPGGLQQTITGLTVGTFYTLSFFYANNPAASIPASATATIDGFSQTVTHSGSTATMPNYTQGGGVFLASASSLVLTFRSNDPANDFSGIILDDVSINPAAVPEPASCVMMGLGLVAVGGFARSRRRTA